MLSALALARRIEAGELTPRAVIELCAAAIAAREGEIGAFAALDLEAARAAAGRGELAGRPLRGLPVGVKDIFDTVDFPTAYGSPIHAGHRPRTDAAMVMLVRRAGGVVLGKTVTTEFAWRAPAHTRNPRNPAHVPGVSSSGSAAAVAAGMVPLALGSQTGGSVIRPAAYCGVAGFKPSYRLLPTVGMKCSSWSLDTVGLFGAGIADVALAAAALSGRDLRVDLRPPPPPAIAIVRCKRWAEASKAMQDAVERAAHAAEKAGARIRDVALPQAVEEARAVHPVISGYEAARSLAFEYDHFRDRMGALLRSHLDEAAAIDTDAYDDARRVARRARLALNALIADGEVLLTPSAPGAAPRFAEAAAPAAQNALDSSSFNALWTLLGTPCLNVPGLAGDDGLPLGVQVVARFGRDRFALSASAFVEAAIARM
jgi:Asp-tRNA(Asn)/Glu-tRNA(Gln) amidotransferase A subunit family amidase